MICSHSVLLQDNDFKLLKAGDPIFQTFSGKTVKYEGEELYPFFVNECAYYEKKIAFHLAKKVTLTLPSISVKKDWGCWGDMIHGWMIITELLYWTVHVWLSQRSNAQIDKMTITWWPPHSASTPEGLALSRWPQYNLYSYLILWYCTGSGVTAPPSMWPYGMA